MRRKTMMMGLTILFAFILSACNLPSQGNGQLDGANDGNGPAPAEGNADSSIPGDSPTDTPTATASPLPPTEVPTDDTVTVTVSQATNCRSGPLKEHDLLSIVNPGQVVQAVARPPGSEPYLIINGASGECWLWLQYAAVTGDPSGLPVRAIPATPTPLPNGSIQGVVWLDLCSSGAPGDPPPGCLEGDPGVYYGNGLLEPGEFGIPGVVVDLGIGPCASTGYATATTNAQGSYFFDNLPPGTYCISVSVSLHSNGDDLIPGFWTHPILGVDPAQIEVIVAPGEDVIHQHFGWDFQLD